MERKKKIRGYLESYLSYGFVPYYKVTTLPLCLICSKVYSNETMRLGKIIDHFQQRHPEDIELPLKYFTLLKIIYERNISDMLSARLAENPTEALLKTSFEISLMIAKSGKPHTIGEELIKPAIECYLKNVLGQDAEVVTKLSLSNDTIRKRIDKMGENVETQLVLKLRKLKFSLQLDESTIRRGEALLMAYVRYNENGIFEEEMLFCKNLKEGTTSNEIFKSLSDYLEEKNIPFTNIISCAADGAPAMIGKNNGCLKQIKDKNPSMLIVHCVIHRENLVAKKLSPQLNEILSLVIKCVNAIKSNAKNERLFTKFCETLEAEHIRLLLHTEVRWLSKGNCLKRFLELYDMLSIFLKDNEHMKKLMNDDARIQVAYLADIFNMLKILNLQLQGKRSTLIDAKTKIFGFISELKSLKIEVLRDNFINFPNLRDKVISSYVKVVIVEHLGMLVDDFSSRFSDLKDMEFPTWFTQPLLVDVSFIENDLVKKEFHLLQNDEIVRSLFRIENINMWLNEDVKTKYPISSEIACNLMCSFPSSYLVECGFSTVSDIVTKKRNSIDITVRGDLRLKLTSIVPNIREICRGIQPQPSH